MEVGEWERGKRKVNEEERSRQRGIGKDKKTGGEGWRGKQSKETGRGQEREGRKQEERKRTGMRRKGI